MRAYVTGAASFISSNLVDELLRRGDVVVGFDNLATDRRAFLDQAHSNPNFRFVEGDLKDAKILATTMRGQCRHAGVLDHQIDFSNDKSRILDRPLRSRIERGTDLESAP